MRTEASPHICSQLRILLKFATLVLTEQSTAIPGYTTGVSSRTPPSLSPLQIPKFRDVQVLCIKLHGICPKPKHILLL